MASSPALLIGRLSGVMVRVRGPDPKGRKMRRHVFYSSGSGTTSLSASGILFDEIGESFGLDNVAHKMDSQAGSNRKETMTALVLTEGTVVQSFLRQGSSTGQGQQHGNSQLIPGAEIHVLPEETDHLASEPERKDANSGMWHPATLVTLVDVPAASAAIQALLAAHSSMSGLGWELGWALSPSENQKQPQQQNPRPGRTLPAPDLYSSDGSSPYQGMHPFLQARNASNNVEVLSPDAGATSLVQLAVLRLELDNSTTSGRRIIQALEQRKQLQRTWKVPEGLASNAHLTRGAFLAAVGSPFGILSPHHFINSVTNGVVANHWPANGGPPALIMADMRCLSGMEGAPVLDSRGALIGMLSRPLRQKSTGAEVQLVITSYALSDALHNFPSTTKSLHHPAPTSDIHSSLTSPAPLPADVLAKRFMPAPPTTTSLPASISGIEFRPDPSLPANTIGRSFQSDPATTSYHSHSNSAPKPAYADRATAARYLAVNVNPDTPYQELLRGASCRAGAEPDQFKHSPAALLTAEKTLWGRPKTVLEVAQPWTEVSPAVDLATSSIVLITVGEGSWASGVILNREGLILTNAHLVEPWRFNKATVQPPQQQPTQSIRRRNTSNRLSCPSLCSECPATDSSSLSAARTAGRGSTTANFSSLNTSPTYVLPHRKNHQRIRVRIDQFQRSAAPHEAAEKWEDADVIFVSHGPLDVALLKLRATWPGIRPVVPDMTTPEPGCTAIVIGHGLFGPRSELHPSVSVGVVSRVITAPPLQRSQQNFNTACPVGPMDFATGIDLVPRAALIQTTAAVHAGGSGGAVVSSRGQMLSLVTSNAKHNGWAVLPHLNFSIPSAVLAPVFHFAASDMADISVLSELNGPDRALSSIWALIPTPTSPPPLLVPPHPPHPEGDKSQQQSQDAPTSSAQKGKRFATFFAESGPRLMQAGGVESSRVNTGSDQFARRGNKGRGENIAHNSMVWRAKQAGSTATGHSRL